MNLKSKQIYIIALGVCLILIAGALGFIYFRNSSQVFNPAFSNASSLDSEASGNVTSGFTPPAVFPDTDLLHTEIFDGPFSELDDYQPLDTTGQLRRPDPFKDF